MLRTGFIGLGSQGAPMARRMVEAGYPLALWARRRDTLEPFGDTPATVSESIAALGAASDHVGVCVVDDAGVEQVCAELLSSMQPGSRIVIHSTVHPRTCQTLAERARLRGIALLDAPVSGGASAASAGTLTAMVGGADEDFANARPIIATFAALIVHLGGVGAGQQAKLVNNSLMAAHVALGYEAMLAGDALGIDRAALVELVRASSGRSFGFDVGSRLTDPSAFEHGARLLAKDVGLLGDVLGDHASAEAFKNATASFFARALS